MANLLKVSLSLAFALGLPSLASAANLIVNPGNDLPAAASGITGWTEVLGSNWQRRSTAPLPQAGDAYFFAGPGAVAELSQIVDVSAFASNIQGGTQRFLFDGFVRSYQQGRNDTSQIVLEYLNGSSGILDSFTSAIFADASQWTEITDERLAPVDTTAIRIRLLSVRRTGTNNDGYFDSLSLTPVGSTSTVPEPSTWALITGGFGLAGAFLRRGRRGAGGNRGEEVRALPASAAS